MKFYEAVELGWGLVTPKAYTFKGCALGMAAVAIGGTKKGVFNIVGTKWPWLVRPTDSSCPVCGARPFVNLFLVNLVAHIFDTHLFGTHEISRDQFIDYLRQLEEQATGQGVGTVKQVAVEAEMQEVGV